VASVASAPIGQSRRCFGQAGKYWRMGLKNSQIHCSRCSLVIGARRSPCRSCPRSQTGVAKGVVKNGVGGNRFRDRYGGIRDRGSGGAAVLLPSDKN
jgi:hypothetical protein